MNEPQTPDQLIAKALEDSKRYITASELQSYQRNPGKSLDAYLIDGDFDGDVRNMLIFMADPDFQLADFLRDEASSDRYLDLIRAHAIISMMTRDELSHRLMAESLCPLHRIDWAICFDNDDIECLAIRTIFPHSHDT